jgi:hypothetical protein
MSIETRYLSCVIPAEFQAPSWSRRTISSLNRWFLADYPKLISITEGNFAAGLSYSRIKIWKRA